jgi:hypothetical protein
MRTKKTLRSITKNSNPNEMIVLGLACAFFLVFFRAKQAFRIYSEGDDLCYVQWLFRFIGHQIDGCHFSYSPSIAFAWLPSGIGGIILSKMFKVSLNEAIPALIGIQSFIMWSASLVLLFKSALWKYHTDWLVPLALALSAPVLFYATHRTTLPHTAEFFSRMPFSLLSVFRPTHRCHGNKSCTWVPSN